MFNIEHGPMKKERGKEKYSNPKTEEQREERLTIGQQIDMIIAENEQLKSEVLHWKTEADYWRNQAMIHMWK